MESQRAFVGNSQVVLVMDVAKIHLHAVALRACKAVGIWLGHVLGIVDGILVGRIVGLRLGLMLLGMERLSDTLPEVERLGCVLPEVEVATWTWLVECCRNA